MLKLARIDHVGNKRAERLLGVATGPSIGNVIGDRDEPLDLEASVLAFVGGKESQVAGERDLGTLQGAGGIGIPLGNKIADERTTHRVAV